MKKQPVQFNINKIIKFSENSNCEDFKLINSIFDGNLLDNTLKLMRNIQSEYAVFSGNFDTLYFIKSKDIIDLQRKCSQKYINYQLDKIDKNKKNNNIPELKREYSKLEYIYSKSMYINIYSKSKKEVLSLKNASSFRKTIYHLFNHRKHELSRIIYSLDYLLKKENIPALKDKTSTDFHFIFEYCNKRQPEIERTIEEIKNAPIIKSSLLNDFKENQQLLKSKKDCFIQEFKENFISGLIANNNILSFFEKNGINPTNDILLSIETIKNNNFISLLKNDDNFFDFEDDIAIKRRLNSKSPSFF